MNTIAKYTMYVFKESGKYYTVEEVDIDTNIWNNYEIAENIRNEIIDFGYNNLFRVFIPHVDNDIKYSIPFYVSPNNPNT